MKDRKLLNSELGRLSPEQYASAKPSGIAIVLDNVRSSYNIGSVFRSADAFHVDKIWLCGICAVPPSAEIHKTALGAESSVPWEQECDTMGAIRRLRAEGYKIISVEQTEHAIQLNAPEALKQWSEDTRCAFVFGNEVEGVQQAVVDSSDFSLEIPQYGTKHSLNVAVSVGIVLWAASQI